MKKLMSTFLLFLLFLNLSAQEAAMADQMRSEGKIYVVVGVVVLIFAVLFAYLISIDRKLRNLEKEIEKK